MSNSLMREPLNAAPMAWFKGTKDNSRRSVPLDPQTRPMHLAWLPSYMERGPIEPQFLTGTDLIQMYGSKFLDEKSKYASPTLDFIQLGQDMGNLMMLQRILPSEIATHPQGIDQGVKEHTAYISLALVVEKTDIDVYDRDAVTGLIKLTESTYVPAANQGGAYTAASYTLPKRKLKDGKKVKGLKARWVLMEQPGRNRFATPNVKALDVEGNEVLFPVMDIDASWFGEYGNNLAMSLWAPTTEDSDPLNFNLMRDQLSYLYRVSFAERESLYQTAMTISNNYGDAYTEISFKEGAYNKNAGNLDLFIDDVLLDNYRDLSPVGGRTPVYGPFNKLHVYHDSIQSLLKLVYEEEIKVNVALQQIALNTSTGKYRDAEEAMYLINFVSGVDHVGDYYHTFRIENEITQMQAGRMGIKLDRDQRVFAIGGKDGTMSKHHFDKDVGNMLAEMGKSSAVFEIRDMAQYPFRNFYDVGYSWKTKEKIARLLGIRPDINITLVPYVLTAPTKLIDGFQQDDVLSEIDVENNKRKLSHILANLKRLSQWLNNYPESVIHGTSVCRAVLPAQLGEKIGGNNSRDISSSLELFAMRARYMGESEPRMTNGRAYDESPGNLATVLKNFNIPAVFGTNRETLWANGGVWFQNKRRNTPFCPAVQTAYEDDTSVLNSDINMQIMCEINMIHFEVWSELTGSSRYSDDEFVSVADKLISDRCRGRFDNRVIVTPQTQLTEKDKLRGWSWTSPTKVEFPSMRTVSANYVIAHRIGE